MLLWSELLPNSRIVSLSVWFADTLVYDGRFEPVKSPDVAKAMGRNDWLGSGWRVRTELPDNLKNKASPGKVSVKFDNGMEAKLLFQRELVPINIDEYRVSYFAKGTLVALTPLALLFFFLFAVKLVPVSELQKEQIGSTSASKLKNEEWSYRIFFFVIALAGGKFLLMKFTPISNVNLLAVIFAITCSCIIAYGTYSRLVTQSDNRNNLFLIAGVLFYLSWMYAYGIILPANDPVAVPTFASIINRNVPLYEHYAQGDSGATYPPGFPLLLSVAYVFFDHTGVLLLFKILCILAVGLIPFSWSWLAKRVFDIPLPLATIAIAFYIASFGIERTLNYALPFAGKNSQLFLLSVFPLFFVYLVNSVLRNWTYLLVLGFMFYCLALFHYSVFYISFALLMATSIVWFWLNSKRSYAIAGRGLLVGLIGVGCFVFFSSEALHDPRISIGSAYDLAILSAVVN